jgi:hypothetical protein
VSGRKWPRAAETCGRFGDCRRPRSASHVSCEASLSIQAASRRGTRAASDFRDRSGNGGDKRHSKGGESVNCVRQVTNFNWTGRVLAKCAGRAVAKFGDKLVRLVSLRRRLAAPATERAVSRG